MDHRGALRATDGDGADRVSPAARMTAVDKSFGDVRAVQDVSLTLEAGCIHAVVGENGAGKTTLMRILYGACRPDAGTIALNGATVRFRNPADAARAGVGMVSQHYSIIPQLTCLENLVLGAEPGRIIRRREAAAKANEIAKTMGFEFDWNSEAASLSPAGAQKLEILKLLWREARIMILDEPTAMLAPSDAETLFAGLKRLADLGAAVVLVTHRLPEVLQHCRRVTVLRAGRNVADADVQDTNAAQLAEWIIGHSPAVPTVRTASGSSEVALDVRELRVRGARGEEALKGVTLRLRKGELLGLAGVDGSGQRELLQTLLGILRPMAGTQTLGDIDLDRLSTAERIGLGVRLIPEDRHIEGTIPEWSLAENAALGLQRLEPFARGRWVDADGRERKAVDIAARFDTQYAGVRTTFASLSGGNQQRFVAGRALCLDPKLILAFQPARGLDIEATRRLYEALRFECAKGAAALIVSFDLDELLENCDRVVAMRAGNLYEPPAGMERDRSAIGTLMVGAA